MTQQLANINTYNIDHSEGYVYTGGTFQYKDHDHGVILAVSDKHEAVFRRNANMRLGLRLLAGCRHTIQLSIDIPLF
jgi:hypothetical protein